MTPASVHHRVHHKSRRAAVVFPTAPFYADDYRDGTSIYVNQFGYAVLRNEPLDAQHPAGKYDVFFDDGGTVRVDANGSIPVDLAYYNETSSPTVADTSGDWAGASVTSPVPPNKGQEFIAVQPYVTGSTGTYDLRVYGVPVNVWDQVDISPRTDRGSGMTSISGPQDFDFWEFTVPRAGNWVVTVKPTHGLDVSLNAYDRKGNPVAGTFTQPVDDGGRDEPETWTAAGLAAGQTAYFRVNGADGSYGGHYYLSVALSNAPDVRVRATSRTATSRTAAAGGGGGGGTETAEFTVSRSAASRRTLAVRYAVSGVAADGHATPPSLSGVAYIPAGQLSTTVTVQAAGALAAAKDVVLSLSPDSHYNLTGGAGDVATASVLS